MFTCSCWVHSSHETEPDMAFDFSRFEVDWLAWWWGLLWVLAMSPKMFESDFRCWAWVGGGWW